MAARFAARAPRVEGGLEKAGADRGVRVEQRGKRSRAVEAVATQLRRMNQLYYGGNLHFLRDSAADGSFKLRKQPS